MIFVCNSWLCLALYLLGTGFLGCSTIQEVSGILQPGWIREVWPNHGSWLVAGFFRINHVAGISSNPYGLFKTNNWFGCGHGVGQVSVWSKHDWTLPEIVTDPQYEYCSLANLWNGWAYNVDMPCFKWESKSQLENWTNNFHGNNSRLCIYIYSAKTLALHIPQNWCVGFACWLLFFQTCSLRVWWVSSIFQCRWDLGSHLWKEMWFQCPGGYGSLQIPVIYIGGWTSSYMIPAMVWKLPWILWVEPSRWACSVDCWTPGSVGGTSQSKDFQG